MIITDEKILRKVSTEWSGKPEELEKLLEKMTKAMEERFNNTYPESCVGA